MRSIYSISTLGTMALILYILFDFFKNKTNRLLPRLVFYSFIFYMCNVLQLTTGGIAIPPMDNHVGADFQLIPFYFIADLMDKLSAYGFEYRFFSAFKLYFYNFIMLMPFGVYLTIYFKIKSIKKATLMILSLAFGIEILQAILSANGLLMASRTSNIDDVILNASGAILAYLLTSALFKKYFSRLTENNKGAFLRELQQEK